MMDGISGMIFHASLLSALNNPTTIPSQQNGLIQLPKQVFLTPSIEQRLKFPISWPFFLREVWKSIRPAFLTPTPAEIPWTGPPCSPTPISYFTTHIRLITLAPDSVAAMIQKCRHEKVTLTALLHAVVVTSLATRLPDASSFKADTPYSLRHLTGEKGMANQVSGYSHTFALATVNALRRAAASLPSSSSDPDKLTRGVLESDEIWNVAREFKTELSKDLETLPRDNILGMLAYLTDHFKFITARMYKPRGSSYEISNVGVMNLLKHVEKAGQSDSVRNEGTNTEVPLARHAVAANQSAKPTPSEPADSTQQGRLQTKPPQHHHQNGPRYQIPHRIIFTQSGNCTGPALNFNLASAPGPAGALSITVTWLAGEVDDSLARAVAGDVGRMLGSESVGGAGAGS